jgi:hypothetical protein
LNLLNANTARDYTLLITAALRPVFSVTLLGNGFQQWMFLGFRAAELSLAPNFHLLAVTFQL